MTWLCCLLQVDDMIFMSNEHLEAVIDPLGRLVALYKPGCKK